MRLMQFTATYAVAVVAMAVCLSATPTFAHSQPSRDATHKVAVPNPQAAGVPQQPAELMVSGFLDVWRNAWMASDQAREEAGLLHGDELARFSHIHCHIGTFNHKENGLIQRSRGYITIQGSFSNAQPRCPSWLLGTTGRDGDEADNLDAAILPEYRAPVIAARSRLLSNLATLQESQASSAWLLGQRVRFGVDAGRADESLQLVDACGTDRWWCALLSGFVRARQGHWLGADSMFTVAMALLPPTQRCIWSDVGMLLPKVEREQYERLSCRERDSLATRYFWLASPRLSTGYNERRVEHFSRRVSTVLRSALPRDEQYRWGPEYAGAAVAEMIVRYGVPSAAVWLGRQMDLSHSSYLHFRDAKPNEPYSSAEYSSPRVRFGAPGLLFGDAFGASENDWHLLAPDSLDAAHRSGGNMWWPVEHMRLREGGSVVQLPSGQLATFRRQSEVRVVAAIDVSQVPALVKLDRESRPDTVTLVASSSPQSRTLLGQVTGSVDSLIVVDGAFEPTPALIGVELSGGAAPQLLARTRRGLIPPSTLAGLTRGEIAVSEPAFFSPKNENDLPADLDAMIPRMMGSTSIARGSRVGLYWEVYGVPTGDSLRFAISVLPRSGPGVLQRMGAALRILDSPMNSVAIAWKDPAARARDASGIADVPIVPRSMLLDLARLKPGDYVIEILAEVAGRTAAQSMRPITVR